MVFVLSASVFLLWRLFYTLAIHIKTIYMYDSKADTLQHIKRVNELLTIAATTLLGRAIKHDQSKLESPEKEMFDQATEGLRGLTYGSPEYKESLKAIKPALDHHYAHNSHHPEHYNEGVNGMDLFDVLEMLLDWKAAGERHADGDIMKSLEINKERFGISKQLAQIMENTIVNMELQTKK